MVIVVDDEDRENEGDLTIAAEKVTPDTINFMARYGRGQICLSMTGERLDELEIPLAVNAQHARRSDGVLRADRREARTTTGHLGGRSRGHGAGGGRSSDHGPPISRGRGTCSPLRARDGGVMVRAGQTEASVDLARIAGLYPGRRDLRGDERRRHDGARAAAGDGSRSGTAC